MANDDDDDFGSNIPKKVKSKGKVPPVAPVAAAEDDDDGEVVTLPPPRKKRAQPPTEVQPAQGMPKKFRIILEENEVIPPTGLYLSHNGRPYVIQTGVEVDIPHFLKEILDNAVISVPVTEPSTQQVIGYRNRLRYPYRVI